MDFGRLDAIELEEIDFTLPPDGEQTNKTFSILHGNDETRFHLGCPRWGEQEWNGVLFPKGTKMADMLPEYVKHFNSIELNAVFYSLPDPALIKRWLEPTMPNIKNDFLFCPKISRNISHVKRLVDCEDETNQFLESISEFKEYLGPILIQLSDNFPPKNYSALERFLSALPKDKKFFVELRHPDWFSNHIARRTLFSMLADLNIGAVLTDTAGRRDVLHMELPIPEVFIRFIGNGGPRLECDFKRIDSWVNRIKHWQNLGLEKVYFFVHQLEVSYGAVMQDGEIRKTYVTTSNGDATLPLADYTIKQFNKHLGAQLPELKFL